jgi:hypothetical protein
LLLLLIVYGFLMTLHLLQRLLCLLRQEWP